MHGVGDAAALVVIRGTTTETFWGETVVPGFYGFSTFRAAALPRRSRVVPTGVHVDQGHFASVDEA